MDEDWPGWRPMCDAPRDRSVRVKLRDGRTCLVRWDRRTRHGETVSFWSVPKHIEEWGWCHRNVDRPLDERDILGWIDAEEGV